jgi:parallel beta-helix repeat protein
MHFSRRTALLLGSSSTLASVAALNGLVPDLSAMPSATAATVGSRAVPSGAVIASAGGAKAALAKVPSGGTLVLRGGTYAEALGTITKSVTIQSYPGETAWFDGGGSKASAFLANAKVNLYDVGVRNYSPAKTGWMRGMVCYSSGATGSVISGCTFTGSKMASMAISGALTITGNTFSNNGWSGIMGTDADNLVFTGNTISGMNRDNHAPEPETAAIKLTRSANVLIKNNTVTDVAGAYGIWFDVSSTNAKVIGNHVDGKSVGGRAAMKQTAEFELYEGGVCAGNVFTGSANAGLRMIDAGHLRVWNNDLRGNPISMWLQQDSRKNSGSNPANLKPAVAPWQSIGNEVCNNSFGPRSQLWAYDSGNHTFSGEDMLGRVAGNWFAIPPKGVLAIRMGRKGSTAVDSLSMAQLKSALGSTKGGTNYQGASSTDAAKARVAVPADIAALLK